MTGCFGSSQEDRQKENEMLEHTDPYVDPDETSLVDMTLKIKNCDYEKLVATIFYMVQSFGGEVISCE